MVVMGRTAHLGLFAAPSERDRAKARGALEPLGVSNLADTTRGSAVGGASLH
jgi:iron complex transport system ATP-binding protein